MQKKIALHVRIQLSFSLLLIIFLSANTLFSNIYLQHSIKDLLLLNQTHILDKSLESIENEFRRLDNIALKVLYQAELKNIMNKAEFKEADNYFVQDHNSARKARFILSQMIGPEEIPLRISLFTNNGDYIDFGWQPVNSELVKANFTDNTIDSLTKKIDSKGGGCFFVIPEDDVWYDKGNGSVYSIYREFRDLFNHYGYIHIQEPFRRIEKLLASDVNGIKFILKDAAGDIIYDSFNGPFDRSEFYMISKKSEYTGWILELYQSSDIYLTPIRRMRQIDALLALLLLTIGTLIISLLSRILTKPLKQLHESIYKVNLQNLEIKLEDKDSHQIIKQLNNGFLLMFRRLQDSVEQQIQSKESEVRAHMTALQNQMNPHLLYNMLAHISSLAAEEETGKIEEICQRLSSSLRYMSKPDLNPVQLTEELKHLQDYLSLMKSHYDPLFNFSITTENGPMKDCRIPKLIFQPIAENAFSHGFHNMDPPWRIDVTISNLEGKFWTIRVTDNGSGINPETKKRLIALKTEPLPELRERTIERTPGGLGLMNTIARMRLMYEDNIIFEIDRIEGSNSILLGGPLV